jgi:ribosomal protein S27AE
MAEETRQVEHGYAAPQERPVDKKPRCRNCGKILAYHVGRPWRIKCDRCGVITGS